MTRAPIRVLVVDDSVVARQLLIDALKTDSRLKVIGAAQNGKVALEMIERLKPEAITLDLEMPELDGFGVLDALRQLRCSTPVIVLSSLTERGAAVALDALARGASDCYCKPSGQRGITSTLELIRSDLIPRICGLVERGLPSARPPPAAEPARIEHPAPSPAAPAARAEVITIGVSTGGPSALSELIPALPKDLARAVLIVQHMPPAFTRLLSERLGQKSALSVQEAKDGEALVAGRVYIAPGNQHMRVSGTRQAPTISLDQGPLENGCRPSADVLFRSAASVFDRGVVAVVLTGIGSDGTHGAEAVRKAGGQVWVQDAASAVAWGMPGSVVRAGHATRELPLGAIASAIVHATRVGSPSGSQWTASRREGK